MDSNETPKGGDVRRSRVFTPARRVVLTGVLTVAVSAGAVSLASAANSHHAANAARPAVVRTTHAGAAATTASAVTVAAKTKSTTQKSTPTHKCPNMTVRSGGSGGSSGSS